jgi:hypothetical protein
MVHVVGFSTTYAVGTYHHQHCEFESRSDEVYSIQPYMIMFFSDLCKVGSFLRVLRFPPTNNTDRHDIIEILLKVVFNTITITVALTLNTDK